MIVYGYFPAVPYGTCTETSRVLLEYHFTYEQKTKIRRIIKEKGLYVTGKKDFVIIGKVKLSFKLASENYSQHIDTNVKCQQHHLMI